ncbi:tail fiber domain-containing protein [Siphonobacter curvatus]|uniref:Peptidase S74 domain-containing protein n=1 Tax=Siphonobacter curvatus TaxID=2094562 RepID=A0A2S7IJY2_9BACT|nr:tail fiber domain-containing protein [Siphonobacter curvatus]PQA56958.1 hypothetical protein C5O19_16630 [Siphonobacter curvatus]
MKTKQLLTTACFLAALSAAPSLQAQMKIGGTGAPNAAALLDLNTNPSANSGILSKGLLMPRAWLTTTTTWGLAGSAVTGMTVYNGNGAITSENVNYPAMGAGEYYFDGTGWVSKKLAQPWNVIGTTNPATSNNQHIYQKGWVSIGTSQRQGRLTIVNDGAGTGDEDNVRVFSYGNGTSPGLILTSSRGSEESPSDIVTNTELGSVSFGGRVNNAFAPFMSRVISYYKGDGTNNLSTLQLQTSGTNRLMINEEGRFGLGTVNPQFFVETRSGRPTEPVVAYFDNGGDIGADRGIAFRSGGGAFFGYGRFAEHIGAKIIAGSDKSIGFFTHGDSMNPSDSSNRLRMTISWNGRVGIGTSAPGYNLDVAGTINASANVRAGGVVLTSDARLKRNIKAVDNGLSLVSQLKPVSYEKKSSVASQDYNRSEIGFIAQDLQKVLPMLVEEGNDADKTLSVDYNSLIPVLTKAIQELNAKVEALTTENTQLRTAAAKAENAEKAVASLSDQIKELQQLLGVSKKQAQAAK